MKIKRVEAIKVAPKLNAPAHFATRTVDHREYTVVQIETDTGLTGVGIAWFLHTADIVTHQLAPLLIGNDPFEVEANWDKMYREVYRERKGAAVCAVSVVDVALWDILGKALGKPLYMLLGGYRSSVPCYASGGYYREGKGVEGLRKEVRRYVDAGFTGVKIKVGALPLDKDLERVRAAMEEAGPGVKVAVDANNAYDRIGALKAGREYEKLGVWWFEEPLMPDDVDGMAELAQVLDTPIAAGELEYTRHGFRELITRKAVDIVQADSIFCGGVTEFMKIAKTAEVFSVPVAPHNTHNINAHLVAAIPNGLSVEYFFREADIMKDMELYTEDLVPENGYIKLPNKPGLGFELNHSAIEKWRV